MKGTVVCSTHIVQILFMSFVYFDRKNLGVQKGGPPRQHEVLGNKPLKLCSYSPEPRAEVYCRRLNFDISKLVYSVSWQEPNPAL